MRGQIFNLCRHLRESFLLLSWKPRGGDGLCGLCVKNPEGEHIFHFQSKKGLLGFPSLDATERASQAFPVLGAE